MTSRGVGSIWIGYLSPGTFHLSVGVSGVPYIGNKSVGTYKKTLDSLGQLVELEHGYSAQVHRHRNVLQVVIVARYVIQCTTAESQ